MAKNPNKNPEKGFLDELTDPGSYVPDKAKAPQKPFIYDKPVAGGESRPNQMNVPRRLNEQKKVGRPKSSMASEMIANVAKRNKGQA